MSLKSFAKAKTIMMASQTCPVHTLNLNAITQVMVLLYGLQYVMMQLPPSVAILVEAQAGSHRTGE